MNKIKTIYFCKSCGNEFSRWSGQCSACKEWNTLSEEPTKSKNYRKNKARQRGDFSQLQVFVHEPMTADDVPLDQQQRCSTGVTEFDRVLGGGIVSGSVILIGGDPGVGKSTLLTQIVAELSQTENVLYISGEESLAQISQRCRRLSLSRDKLWLLASTDIDDILFQADKQQPAIMVIDSIQTVYGEQLNSAAGSIPQVRECCAQLVRYAKNRQCAIFVIGHVTKDGHIAGPRILEHMVDTVLYLEGESDPRYRVLRVIKNRFGAVNEIAIFAMTNQGMKQISNPSAIFLTSRNSQDSGSVVSAVKEGSRTLLIEIQALVDQSYAGSSKRLAVGIDYNRLSMLLAVLHRHAGVSTYDQDFYINIVGGLKIQETAIDLTILSAIYSSYKSTPLPIDLVVFGEVGLTGEVRPVADGEARLLEAEKQGFKTVIVPAGNLSKHMKIMNKSKMNIIGVKNLAQTIAKLSEL